MKYHRYNASVSRLSFEGDHKSAEKYITSLEFMAPWTKALADNEHFFPVQYEVSYMKSQVSGHVILFIRNQLYIKKPFNVSQGRYIGKPQTLHTKCCWF